MRRLCLLTLLLAMSLAAASQVRLGARAGLTVGKLRFDRNIVGSRSRVGYTAGLVLDMPLPVTGLGIEAAVMYVHRDNRLTDNDRLYQQQYFDVPVVARFGLELPAVQHVVVPFVFAGPRLSVLFDQDGGYDECEQYKVSFSWDVGGGVELFEHLRLAASYELGITRAIEVNDGTGAAHGKDRYWTLSAAWLF